MSNNNGASNNLIAFLSQIWGGISFVIGVVTCLLGWIQVAQGDLGLFTLILLGVGISALFLACVYYVWFWKPESEDRSRAILIPDSRERVSAQQKKERRRKKARLRLLARLGLFIIPILTVVGIAGWQYYMSLPTQDFIILVANFEASESQDELVTPVIFQSLEREMTDYGDDVKVEKLGKPLTSIKAAKQEGTLQKAAIVIWGEYQRLDKIVPISVNFEILKPTSEFPQLGESVQGKYQPFAIAELNSFELQTRLSQEMTYLSLFTLGMYRYLDQDWSKASEWFNKALAALESTEEPVTALGQEVVYLYLGLSSGLQKDYKNAINYFDQAIEFKPEYSDAFNNRGTVYYDCCKHYDRAFSDFTQAIKINPQYAQPYYNRGIVYTDLKQYEKAIANYTKAIKINSQYASAYLNRGNIYHDFLKQYEKALDDYERVLEIEPNSADAYNNRGIVYTDLKQYEKALADYNKAIEIEPNFAEAYNSCGATYYDLKQYDRALSNFTKAIDLNPNLAEAYRNRGIVYFKTVQNGKAIADLTKAINLNPRDTMAYISRGGAYQKLKRYDEAIADFTEVIDIDSQNADAHLMRGIVYAFSGDFLQGRQDLERAATLFKQQDKPQWYDTAQQTLKNLSQLEAQQ